MLLLQLYLFSVTKGIIVFVFSINKQNKTQGSQERHPDTCIESTKRLCIRCTQDISPEKKNKQPTEKEVELLLTA